MTGPPGGAPAEPAPGSARESVPGSAADSAAVSRPGPAPEFLPGPAPGAAAVALLDHLVLAAPDLAATVAWFTATTGVTPAPGGSHPGLGTANALVGLGPDRYLEIVGPDPQQPAPASPRPFGIDDLVAPALVAWAVRPPDLDAAVATTRAAGHDPGSPAAMSRRTPDGTELRWRLTPLRTGVVPFLIDWGATPHPARRLAGGVELVGLTLRHPDPDGVHRVLAALGVNHPVERGPEGLAAELHTPRGRITLRPP